jgi:hypothetical protein
MNLGSSPCCQAAIDKLDPMGSIPIAVGRIQRYEHGKPSAERHPIKKAHSNPSPT